MKNLLFLSLFLLFCSQATMRLLAQPSPAGASVEGTVYELHKGRKEALIGVNIYWAGTTQGTITDGNGKFAILPSEQTNRLVVSYAGFQTDTLIVEDHDLIEVVLQEGLNLEEVEVKHRRKTTEFSMINPIKIESVGEGELEKAACCNLSESFETNPSVDVSFTDAITGTKQIQMLGLAGPYTQITRENIPDIRGLSSIFGMEYLPGPWIESIQLNKGTGSVVNGFESIAGQINAELRKPETADRLYLNVFGNQESRLEANLILKHELSENLGTALLLHARTQSVPMDYNGDGFMDKPLGKQFIALNRWEYHNHEGWHSQFSIKGTSSGSEGGQMPVSTGMSENPWTMAMNARKLESWFKLGKVSEDKPYRSFGFQLAGTLHEQDSRFGNKTYLADQHSLYANLIFQSVFGDTRHKYKTGISWQADEYNEMLDSLNYERLESVPGVFFEYTWSPNAKFDLVTGIRGDYHNQYGLFMTPRMHIRYAPAETSVFRFSAGRGLRTASILAENMAILASSREVIIQGEHSDTPYGLDPELAWNLGGNFTQKFRLDYREGAISFDLYYTTFQNQIVVDLDQDPQTIMFYNLEGKSTSTSFQGQLDYELIQRLDLRLAYRWYDVKTQYLTGLQSKPLVSRNRAFLNLAYQTRNHWKFDYTVQWHGARRIPLTASNPVEYQMPENSPAFFLMNAQISKEWRESFEIYLGGENLLNFKQENPILAADDPFGPYFDSSLIWGPVFGRMFYGGIRLKIK
ncbi:MAG: TonB-dependent receptor [Bacteroidales bacterium]|nr:TonB-dependent receptor [Bacteroidales bacterium]